MNEQLRKAILEATRVEPWQVPHSIGAGRAVDELEHVESKAKLLRVIEMLVRQRNEWIEHVDLLMNSHHRNDRINQDDAELIAALEQGRDE